MSDPIAWHRPEYRDQSNQLINLVEFAALAGVTRAAVSNWRKRHDFPAPAMTAGRGVWVVRAEAEQWLTTHRARRAKADASEARADQLAAKLATLEAREKRQAANLAATRKKLRAARTRLDSLDN